MGPGPLASPLDQRTAELRSEPGQGTRALPAVAADILGAGVVNGVLAKVTGAFDALAGAREITLPVGLPALLLALVLGASHAAMPGHGKTIMAAYLAGRRGTGRDAFTVGATVTLAGRPHHNHRHHVRLTATATEATATITTALTTTGRPHPPPGPVPRRPGNARPTPRARR
ncbi:hypothetical protein ACOZFM_14625 [Streptomyces arboris]|uniref:hypothetical protein n=1 Tax=Streptomyces TaxID=1883 RepID=UPI0036420D23